MKPEAQRLALASISNGVIEDFAGEWAYYDPESGAWIATDILNDLNALRRILGRLADQQWEDLADHILFGADPSGGHSNYSSVRKALETPTEQLAEAILRATNLWTDDER